MKLIIEQDGIKREVEGPFNLCISVADLVCLQEQIAVVLAPRSDSDSDKPKFCYGWFTVWSRPKAICNTPPSKWHE